MQDRRQTIRPWIVFALILIGAACLVFVRDTKVADQIQSLRKEKQELLEQHEDFKTRVQKAETSVADLENRIATQPLGTTTATPVSPATQNRIAVLESQLRDLQSAQRRRQSGPLVPEYDPTNPQPLPSEPEPEPQTNTIPMRSWGTEQALGAPNTERAGDLPSAWASRDPDAGPEWLSVGFEHAVDLAEIRVRETFNPGAISKITALENGQEIVLWEGVAAADKALRDFVLPVTGNVRAQSVVIHLDTTRVPGWNEIDAVELVGRDGSRQWATTASARSTYAEAQPQANQLNGRQ